MCQRLSEQFGDEKKVLPVSGKDRTEVKDRTAELYSELGNSEITELLIIDQTMQCEMCRDRNGKGRPSRKCGSILPGLDAERKKRKETTKQVMICLRGLQWQNGRTRGLTRHFSQERKNDQDAKHHF